MRYMKVALVYDRVNKYGGAERVLLALHKIFPNASLYTSVYNQQTAGWARVFDVRTSFLQRFPISMARHETYPFLMPVAFESFSFDGYDVVVSVTSEAAKGIITKPSTVHICYLLTPTRYLWSGYEHYFSNSLFRFLSKPVVSYLRVWDRVAAQRPDYYIAISQEVKKRIRTYYDRDSKVVYPPVEIPNSNPPAGGQIPNEHQKTKEKPDERYFLVVSRLVSYKRIDIAIEACNRLSLPLKIVGTGFEEKKLKKLAGPTVELLGFLTDDEIVGYYKGCRALVFPAKEDFGLTVIEAQLFGKPIIAYKAGGALETVIEGKTGVFFSPQTVDALAGVLAEFEDVFEQDVIRKNAQKFTFDAFKKSFLMSVERIMEKKDSI